MILSYVTFGNLGLAIVVLTIIIKLLLYPLSRKAIVSQIELAEIQKDINDIKKRNLSKEEEAKATFALYKEKKVNPFSGCLVLLIQLPIILGLYYVFLNGLDFQNGNFYSFIKLPESVNTMFLGIINLLEKNSIIFAILSAGTMFLQVHFSPIQKLQKVDTTGQTGFSANLQKTMQTQMKYVFPVVLGIVSYNIQSAVGLYFTVSNLITMVQERMIYKSIKNKQKVFKKSEIVS